MTTKIAIQVTLILKSEINFNSEKTIDESISKAKLSKTFSTIIETRMLNQPYVALEISEMEFQDQDDVIFQGDYREKMPAPHEFKVLKWEYFPINNKAQVYVSNDL